MMVGKNCKEKGDSYSFKLCIYVMSLDCIV